MIKKRLSLYSVLLLIFLLATIGCSAVREISVVSHGDEIAQVKDVVSEPEPRPSPVVPDAELDKKEPLAAVLLSPPPAPSALPSIVERDIYAQSAADITLPWTVQDVFFDYDQMAIRKDAVSILEQNAKVLLKRYPNRAVLIEGHCDERGTEAYNLILGERRASAVKSYLVNLGVMASRLRVLSLGKSQPFCPERTLRCFQSNRRAHFVLK
ncbi:MAG: OmpA family protein [Nitrospirota bacterium]|nr:OmpA family protein [Nitrospirota bacterium]MDH5586646.1 OmpA family protein [Nitrospirota bacterium]MDH5774435.1 OmpA family protein [Nitrospirota bacterium]